MRHLIIGAGATLAEAQNLGCAPECQPPLIRDFAKKTWANYSPHPVLEAYLEERGYTELGKDPRELFFQLEAEKAVSIESFLEYAWINRNKPWKPNVSKAPPGYISGLRISSAGGTISDSTSSADDDFWDNLLYQGIGSPMQFIMSQCFFENGVGWKNFSLSQKVASTLSPGDLVLNLNYDTVFELALGQANISFVYAPNAPNTEQILVCKPHGSLNLVSNDQGFAFGQPEWLGMPQRPGYKSYSGLIPPRLNKNYEQQPIARMILEPVVDRKPDQIIVWGVGFTESDVDLEEIFKNWTSHAAVVEVINPDNSAAERLQNLVSCNVAQLPSVEDWHQHVKGSDLLTPSDK